MRRSIVICLSIIFRYGKWKNQTRRAAHAAQTRFSSHRLWYTTHKGPAPPPTTHGKMADSILFLFFVICSSGTF